MGKPDALSRHADHGSGHDDNHDITLLGPKLFRIHALSGMNLVGAEQKIMQDIWQNLDHGKLEESVAKAARELWKNHGPTSVCSAEWSVSEGLIHFHRKIYVPKNHDLHCHIILQHHDSFIAGHPGSGRCWNSSHEIIGGHRCCELLVCTVAPVTPVTAQNFTVVFHKVSFILQRHHLNNGIK
jgi:hypothetical protein